MKTLISFCFFVGFLLFLGCHSKKSGEYTSLFDGKTFEGWHRFNGDSVKGWKIENGELIALGLGGDFANDIVTDDEYENFELSIEWKIGEGGNSGIFFLVEEGTVERIYESGIEYQLIDDVGFPAKLEEWQKTAACYGMHMPDNNKKRLKPVGEFNHSRIIVNEGHVSHYLNDSLVLEYDLWTSDWEARIRLGKFADMPHYSQARKGKIGLQDHGGVNAFRNISVKKL